MKQWSVILTTALVCGSAQARDLTVRDVVASMTAAWNKVDSYTCRMDAWTQKGSQQKTQAFTFAYKKPGNIRLKVLANPHKGADVVYRNGSIRAAERVLGIRVKAPMSPKDPLFYNLRGVPFWKVDMGGQIADMIARTKRATCVVRRDGDAVVVSARWKEAAGKKAHVYVRTWRVDSKSWFPAEYMTTEDGRKVEEVKATDVNLRAAVKDSDFDL